MGREADRFGFRHLGVKQHGEHGREIALEALAAPGQPDNHPILRAREGAVQPTVQPWSAYISQRGQPDDSHDPELDGRGNAISRKDQTGECRQLLPVKHSAKDLSELGQHHYPDEDWRNDHGWGDGEGQQDEVVERAAHGGDAVPQEQAARGQDLPDIADALAGQEHGADLRGEEPGHLFERLAEPQPPFNVGRQEMKADAQRAVAAGGGAGDSGFRRAAFLQAELEQVQEQPDTLISAQRQSEQEVEDVNDTADRQQSQEKVDD